MSLEEVIITHSGAESDILSLYRPKFSSINGVMFLVISGAILVLGGWWNVESLLWNRVKYSTGSVWANLLPKFHEAQGWTLDAVKEKLTINSTIFILGIIFVVIVGGFLTYYLIKQKRWDPQVKSLTIAAAITSGSALLTTTWFIGSINVIGSLQPLNDLDQSGIEWIWTDLANYSTFMVNFCIILSIILLYIFVLSIVNLAKNHENQQKTQSKTGIGGIFKHIPFYLILLVYLVFTLFPVIISIQISVSNVENIAAGDLPSTPLYSFILNYSSVMFAVSMDEPSFSGAFMNSFMIGMGTGLLGLSVSVSSAYALARFKFGGNKFLTFLILSTQMFPGIILLLPQYVIWTRLGLVNKLSGLLLASASGSVAYCTWMMKGYFETIPIDIEEAATIDGISSFGNFSRIALPLAKAGLVAVLIFTFLTSWQDFVLARTFIRDVDKFTLPLLADNYENGAVLDAPPYFELLAPYALLVALPVVIFFMLMQKQLAAGAVAGSVK